MPPEQDPRVEQLIRAGLATREQFTVRGSELDVRDIEWASEKEKSLAEYDWTHANQTMLLASRIAHDLALPKRDLEVLKVAALFHDVGRRRHWREMDPDHNRRGADAATTWLQKRGDDTSFIEDVQFVVAHHTLAGTPPTDPRLIALWDADSLEAARFAPGTGDGLAIFNKRIKRAITPFAKDQAVWRRWMKERGWQK